MVYNPGWRRGAAPLGQALPGGKVERIGFSFASSNSTSRRVVIFFVCRFLLLQNFAKLAHAGHVHRSLVYAQYAHSPEHAAPTAAVTTAIVHAYVFVARSSRWLHTIGGAFVEESKWLPPQQAIQSERSVICTGRWSTSERPRRRPACCSGLSAGSTCAWRTGVSLSRPSRMRYIRVWGTYTKGSQ